MDEAAEGEGLSRSDYMKARLFGLPRRDRTSLALINSLHVAGIALTGLLERDSPDDHSAPQVAALVTEMRAIVDRMAKAF